MPLPLELRDRRAMVAVAAIAVGVFAEFWPILRSDFQLEDFIHLYDLANFGLAKLLLAAHGGHSKITSNLVFPVFRGLFGLEPARWFAAALVLHVVNATLLLGLLRRIGCTAGVAFTLALLWALSPLHREDLAWIGTIGQVLIATFALLLLRGMVDAANRGAPVTVARSMGWWALGLAAATSFSMGIAVAGTLWFAAMLLLADVPGRGRTVAILATLVPVFPALYAIQYAVHARLYGVAFHETPLRDVALWPLVEAALHAVRPTADFVTYAVGVLPFWVNWSVDVRLATAGPEQAVSVDTVLVWLRSHAIVALVGLPWALGQRPRQVQRLTVVLCVSALATYGTIAWGNAVRQLQVPEQANLPIVPTSGNQAIVPRYHYVGTLYVAALLALAIDGAARRGRRVQRAMRLGLVLLAAVAILRIPAGRAQVVASVRNGAFFQPRAGTLQQLRTAARAAAPGSVVYLPNRPLGGGFVGLKGPFFPGWSAFCVVFVSPDCVIEGHPIRFVEPDATLLDTIRTQQGTPISRIVVGP